MIGLLACLMAWGEEPADLFDPASRYALALELSQDHTTVEEARDVLVGLLAVPEFRAEALELLVQLVSEQPARVGWAATYKALKANAAVRPEARALIGLRAVQAPQWTAVERRRAIAAAQGIRARSRVPSDDILLALGHLYLLDASPSRALYYFQQVEGDEGAAGVVYSYLASGRVDQIRRAPAHPEVMLAAALSNPTPANRARALFHGGYGYLARRASGSARTCRLDACAALAEIQEAKGDYRQEVIAWKAYVRQFPHDPNGTRELVEAYLDARDLRGATIAAGKDEGLRARIEAVRQVIYMSPIAPVEERDEVTAQAWSMAPTNVLVTVARAKLLTETGRYEEAVSLLEPVTRSRGGDPVVLWAWAQAGIPAGREQDVLALWHVALQRAISVERRRQLGVDLAIVYGIIGEQHKKAGRLREALDSYRVALAMQPGRSDLYAGVGGVLWKSGRKADARRAYLTALSLNPSNLDALASAAILSVDLDDPSTATQLVSRAKATTPAIERAREIVQNAHAIVDAHYAARGDREEGLQTLRNLAIDYPRSPDVLQAVGYGMLELDAPSEALPLFRIAQQLRPGDSWLKLGEITALLAIPDVEAAEEAYAQLEAMDTSEMDPEVLVSAHIALLRAQGNRAFQQGDHEGALELYKEVLELDGRDGWTWVALGDLFLAEHRAAAAMAYYGVALDPDQPIDASRERAARIGQFRCYKQMGRLDEAEALLSDTWTGSLLPEQEADLEREVRLARLEQQLNQGNLDSAQRTLAALAARWPDEASVRVGAAKLELALENTEAAWGQAEKALTLDPKSAEAAVLLRDLAGPLNRWEEAVSQLETAWDLGQEPGVLAQLEEARFQQQVAEVQQLLAAGSWKEAKEKADSLWESSQEDAGHAAWVGGLYLNLQLEDQAALAFERALELEPELDSAIIGQADLFLFQGRQGKAESWLASAFDRGHSSKVGMKLAEVQLLRRREAPAKRTLQKVRTLRPDMEVESRLPVVNLPDGSRPPEDVLDDEPDLDPELLEDIVALEEDIDLPPRPDVAVSVGLMHQAGSEGATYLFGGMIPLEIGSFPVGPLDVEAEILPISLTDGVQDVRGVGVDAGARFDGGRWGGEARIGVSPIGFPGGVTPLYQAEATYTGRPFVIGVGSAREPVTDSLASWAGATDADGTPFGRVSWTWFGGWASLEVPDGLRGGARLWAGWLDGLSMPTVSREQVVGWFGKRFGGPERNVLLQATVDMLVHNRQVDGFEAGQGGAFTPLSYVTAFAEVDGQWKNLAGLDLCGGVSGGIQSVSGADTLYLASGLHPALQVFATLSYPFAQHWSLAGQGYVQVSDGSWMQELGLLSLQYRGETGRSTPLHVAELQGARVSQGGCK